MVIEKSNRSPTNPIPTSVNGERFLSRREGVFSSPSWSSADFADRLDWRAGFGSVTLTVTIFLDWILAVKTHPQLHSASTPKSALVITYSLLQSGQLTSR